VNALRAVLATVGAVFAWLRGRRLGFLAPLVFVLLGLGGLLALAAAVPAVSPFVYLLF
jgi:predicted membrane channel-forming protein YqfA (hemolysin III family)